MILPKIISTLSFLGVLVAGDALKPDQNIFPDWSTVKQFTPDQQAELNRLGSFDVSPNKKNIVFSQSKYSIKDNAFSRSLKLVTLNNSTSIDLTEYGPDNSDSNPIWINDDVIAFLSVRGSPAQNIFALSLSSNAITQVTNYTNDISGIVYSSAANMIAFTSSVYPGMGLDESAAERDRIANLPSSGVIYEQIPVSFWDTWMTPDKAQLFTMPVDIVKGNLQKTGEPVNVVDKYKGKGLEPSNYNFSPDGKSLVFICQIPSTKIAWLEIDGAYSTLADGSAAPTQLNAGVEGEVDGIAISPDGTKIAWLQQFDPKNTNAQDRVILYNVADGTNSTFISDFINSPSMIKFSADSKSLYFVAPVEKDEPLYKADLATQQITRLTGDGTVSNFIELSSSQVVVSLNTFQHPDTIYTISTDGKKTMTQVTVENDSLLNGLWFSPTDTFWFTGPHSSWNDGWTYRWNGNIYTNQGYVVVIINFHGGNAYGQPFSDSILGNWGTHPYYDLMTGLDYFLANVDYVDEKNTVALGASYGGYMINWIQGHTTRFNALVMHDGIFDNIGMTYSTDILGFSMIETGIPWTPEGRAVSLFNSPESYVANWCTPMYVIHSQRDYRVPFSQGLSAFTALQVMGVPSKFLTFPDENHWVLKPGNSLKWHSEVLGWIGKYTNVTTWSLPS
ncbi:hypothetical protein BB558_004754 [Smittium angustum]|uniref:Dipeptidyl-peptidase V n=1 Tax=Smittium angustum TaxID=133377 RepID=A0A2U1J2L0_SMIAN|nr:hypothetical protein BB558_004754 [Smittium angustum]